jgi:hypothetical protein
MKASQGMRHIPCTFRKYVRYRPYFDLASDIFETYPKRTPVHFFTDLNAGSENEFKYFYDLVKKVVVFYAGRLVV